MPKIHRHRRSAPGRPAAVAVLAALLALGLALLPGCDRLSLGEKLRFNGGELYYTKRANKAMATRLGKYLVESKYFDGRRKTVQLDRRDETWRVRLVIKDNAVNNRKLAKVARVLGMQLANEVFEHAPLRLELCDGKLRTVKTIQPLDGRKAVFNKGELYHASSVSKVRADKLGAFLVQDGFFDGTPKTVHVKKDGAAWAVRFVLNPGTEKNEQMIRAMRVMGLQVSWRVFDGEPVVMEITDEWLVTVRTVKSLDDKRLAVGGGELFYTAGVTEDEARALGAFLVAEKFYDGTPKSVRVHKVTRNYGLVWRLQLVNKTHNLDDPKMVKLFREFASELSAKAFGGAKVEVAMCDAIFTEKGVFTGQRKPGTPGGLNPDKLAPAGTPWGLTPDKLAPGAMAPSGQASKGPSARATAP